MSFTLVSMIVGGIVAYANVAYFPMDKGAQLEVKVASLDQNINTKLDRVILMLDKQKGN